MKSRNIKRHIKRLHEISGYKALDLTTLLFLLDNSMSELVKVLEIILNNNDITKLPTTPREVSVIMGTMNHRIYADFGNFFNDTKPIFMYWNDNPMSKVPILKGNNVKKLGMISHKDSNGNTKRDKQSRTTYHKEYYLKHSPKKKVNERRKKPKKISNQNLRNSKKITTYNNHKDQSSQQKLVCIMDHNSKKIIRIRKDEILNELKNKGWKKWSYVPKTAFKTQQNKYKLDKVDKKNKPLVKTMFSNLTKINLLRAFFVKKNTPVDLPPRKIIIDGKKVIVQDKKIKSRIIEVIQKRGKNKPNRIEEKTVIDYQEETKKHQGKDYKKKVYITKDKLVDIKIKRKINTKKKKVKILVKKEIQTIKGKITKIKIPILIKATQCIASVYDIAKSKYNIRQNCRTANKDGKIIPVIVKI